MRHTGERVLIGMFHFMAVAIVGRAFVTRPWLGYVALVAVSVVGLCVVLLKRKELRRLNRWIDDRCQGCGYDLRGLGGSGRCPECGKVFNGLGLDGCGVRA